MTENLIHQPRHANRPNPLRRTLAAGLGVLFLTAGAGNRLAARDIGLKTIADGFTSPVELIPFGDDSGDLLVADQVGKIHILSENGEVSDELFLDLRDRLVELNKGFDERGLLGLALHPDFSANRRLFVYYSAPRRSEAPEKWNHTGHLSEFKVFADDRRRVDPDSERILLQVDQPQFNHNSGLMRFGPDGYLYVPFGDGGNANDTGLGHPESGNGQDRTTLLGSLLRIDVDGGDPYGIPSDNPFVGKDGRDEIYAYGLRNPWGIAFDSGRDGALFLADVGQNAYEEVNIIEKGGNYGWHIKEGFHWFDAENPNEHPDDQKTGDSSGAPLREPILEYKNKKAFATDSDALGICVVGGYVYRGQAIPELDGQYLFADWSRSWGAPDGVVFAATAPADGKLTDRWSMARLDIATHSDGEVGTYVTGFGQDHQGEIYVLTNGRPGVTGSTGTVHKIVPAGESE